MRKTQISYKVMKVAEYAPQCGDGPRVYYQASCGCMSRDHALDMAVMEEDGLSQIRFDIDMTYCFMPFHENRVVELLLCVKERMKRAFQILFFGKARVYHEFIMRDEEHIESFMAALQEGLDFVKQQNTTERE